MRSKAVFVTGIVIGCAAALLVVAGTSTVQGQAQPGAGFAAIPGEKGGLDITGPYDVVADWQGQPPVPGAHVLSPKSFAARRT